MIQELRVKDVELKRLSDMINIEKKERQVTHVVVCHAFMLTVLACTTHCIYSTLQTLQARLSNSECGGVELSKLRDEIAALRTAGK